MSRKKIFFNVLIFFILFIFVVIFSKLVLKNTSNDMKYEDASMKYFDLSYKLKDYKDYSINILREHSGILYGTIEDENTDTMLFSTIATFTYDMKNGEVKIEKYSNARRIIDFAIIKGKSYYCYLEHNTEETFRWSIYSKETNSNEIKLKDGIISNVFEYPRIIGLSDKRLYIVCKDVENTEILHIEDSNIVRLKLINTQKTTRFNMDNMIYDDKKIYYVATNEDNIDVIKCFYINYPEKEDFIYQASSSNDTIYTFNLIKNRMVIQEVKDNKSNLKNLNLESKNIEKTLETELLTFPKVISEKNILFHVEGNVWKTFDINKNNINELKNLTHGDNNVYPKYIVIDKNRILIQKFDNTFYTITIFEE